MHEYQIHTMKGLQKYKIVYGSLEAEMIEKLKEQYPDYIDIVPHEKLSDNELDPTKPMPYFGAVLTKKGMQSYMREKNRPYGRTYTLEKTSTIEKMKQWKKHKED